MVKKSRLPSQYQWGLVKYGGVFNILSTDQYQKLSLRKKKIYWIFRQPLILIPAGFFLCSIQSSIQLDNWTHFYCCKTLKSLLTLHFTQAIHTVREWKTPYWKGKKDYMHMTYSICTLIAVWIAMCNAIGTLEFFLLYISSTSLAGSVGILIFTIQHNFEDSYATDTDKVNHYRAALEGTSILILPKFLNWFTADIAYHHLHHLSASIPNYRLAYCHKDYELLFASVKRLHLRDVLTTFEFQLWDRNKQKAVSRKYFR